MAPSHYRVWFLENDPRELYLLEWLILLYRALLICNPNHLNFHIHISLWWIISNQQSDFSVIICADFALLPLSKPIIFQEFKELKISSQEKTLLRCCLLPSSLRAMAGGAGRSDPRGPVRKLEHYSTCTPLISQTRTHQSVHQPIPFVPALTKFMELVFPFVHHNRSGIRSLCHKTWPAIVYNFNSVKHHHTSWRSYSWPCFLISCLNISQHKVGGITTKRQERVSFLRQGSRDFGVWAVVGRGSCELA